MDPRQLHRDLWHLSRGVAGAGGQSSPVRAGTPRRDPPVRPDAAKSGDRCSQRPSLRRPSTGQCRFHCPGTEWPGIWIRRAVRLWDARWHRVDRGPDCPVRLALLAGRLVRWHTRCYLLGARDRRDHARGPDTPLLLAPPAAFQAPPVAQKASYPSRGRPGARFSAHGVGHQLRRPALHQVCRTPGRDEHGVTGDRDGRVGRGRQVVPIDDSASVAVEGD
jgi:hypothetical protein